MCKSAHCQEAISKNCGSDGVALDKLAQLGTKAQKGAYTRLDLQKKARAKYLTQNLSVMLSNVSETPLKKAYINSYYCGHTLTQEGRRVKTSYCKNRWCIVCNRIRTAKLINGYQPQIDGLEEPMFVTLTIPNVVAADLKGGITSMLSCFKAIQEKFKRQYQRGSIDWKFKGIRKFECTYNPIREDYHPHLHLIVNGNAAAEALKEEWLARYEGTSCKAQDVKEVTGGVGHELFKYFSKIVTSHKGTRRVYVDALDVMFQAMKGMRVFQPFGGLKMVSEEIEDTASYEVEELEDGYAQWSWETCDWVNVQTGEFLTDYVPSEQMNRLIDAFVIGSNHKSIGAETATSYPDIITSLNSLSNATDAKIQHYECCQGDSSVIPGPITREHGSIILDNDGSTDVLLRDGVQLESAIPCDSLHDSDSDRFSISTRSIELRSCRSMGVCERICVEGYVWPTVQCSTDSVRDIRDCGNVRCLDSRRCWLQEYTEHGVTSCAMAWLRVRGEVGVECGRVTEGGRYG